MDFMKKMMQLVIDCVRLRTGSMKLETSELDYDEEIEEGLEDKGGESKENTRRREKDTQEEEVKTSESEENGEKSEEEEDEE